jgi:uncharacterized membrane protein
VGSIEEKLAALPREMRRDAAVTAVSVARAELFNGPIPSPRQMAEYEAIEPGMCERFMMMHEQTEAHKRDFEMTQLNNGYRDRSLGMYLAAFCLGLLIVSALIVAIKTSSPAMVGVFLGVPALGAIPMFIQGRKDGKSG